jgi:cytochrome c553
VGPDGKPLIYVMAGIYKDVGDEDLFDMIAYLMHLPPIDNDLPPTTVGLMSRFLILMDASLLPAGVIPHDHGVISAPEPGITPEYGEYLATACTICHGDNFAGGLTFGSGLNLTSTGDLSSWTEEDFLHVLRTGYTPDGYQLDSQQMPWLRIKKLTDDEIKAIWLHLQSLPPVQGTQD